MLTGALVERDSSVQMEEIEWEGINGLGKRKCAYAE